MAQQTINVGTAPNDGTGTPLRTAFQYTNSNFSELYTAVGPSGNNIVVPGSATITGAATVGSDLSLNGNENYVYLFSNYSIGNNSRARFRAVGAGGGSGYGGDFRISTRASNNTWNTDVLTIDSSANCIWTDGAGGTRMTLNSTGLGVGGSPSYKLSSIGTTNNQVVLHVGNTAGTVDGDTTNVVRFAAGSGANALWANARYDGFSHAWRCNSTTTQAMTLDASGRLLVGTANASVTSETGCRLLLNNGATGHFTVAVTTNQSTAATSCYDFYSTSAAAYRFYVTSAGVINATNTTISAISDARLKENVQDIDVGLSAILALKPRKFDWKAGKGKDIKGDRGFIAQEFEQVFPNLIDEWKDPAPEGEAPYKSVRQDLIPVLVKAIQELAARVETLETR